MPQEKTENSAVDLKRKLCPKCGKEKPIDCFRQYKSGKNNGCYHSYCKECEKIYKAKYAPEQRREYKKRKPWNITWARIKTRCEYDKNHPYHKKGIKAHITVLEIKELWFRDKAYLMTRPSIDRINPDKDYTKKNCRFMELLANVGMRRNTGIAERTNQ